MKIKDLHYIFNKHISEHNFKASKDIFPTCEIKKVSITHDNFHIFTQLNYSSLDIPRQGFKIHISCTLKNYQEILDIITNFCIQNKLTFKYISNKKILEYTLSNKADRSSSGKFITIYPSSTELFVYIVPKLDKLLDNFNGPYILSDKRYRDNNNLYYRYGIINLTDNEGAFFYDKKGNKFAEKRVPYYYLPDFIEEPFPEKNSVSDVNYINKKYFVKNAICFNNGGGIYTCEDVSKNKYILKEGRPYIGSNYSSVIEDKRSEKLFLQNIPKTVEKYFPKFIDDFYEQDNYYLVEDFVEGMTIQEFRSTIFLDLVYSKNSNNVFRTIIKNILVSLINIQKENIFIGDISDTNVIITSNYEIRYIDLEQSKIIPKHVEKIDFFYRTLGYYKDDINCLTVQEQDKQQFGFLLLSFYTKSNYFLLTDKTSMSTMNMFINLVAKDYNIPNDILFIILSLIYEPNVKLDSLIKHINNENANYKKLLPKFDNIKHISDLYISNNEVCSSAPDYAFTNEYLFGNKFNLNVQENCLLEQALLNYNSTIMNEDNFMLTNGKALAYIQKENKKNELELELIEYLENKNIETNEPLGLLEGPLAVIYALSFAKKDSKYLPRIKRIVTEYIQLYLNEYLTKGEYPMHLYIKFNQHMVSTYVENGTAGLVKVLIRLKKIGLDYTKEIVNLSDMLSNITFTQNASYMTGMSGIADTLLDAYLYTNDIKYFTSAKNILNKIPYYIIEIDKKYFITSNDFFSVGQDFSYGNRGVIGVYRRFNLINNYNERCD